VRTREKVQGHNVNISPKPYPKVVASAASSIIIAQARRHGASKESKASELPSECGILVTLGKDGRVTHARRGEKNFGNKRAARSLETYRADIHGTR
jgi:hypothetical protein